MEQVEVALTEMVANWQAMQRSDLDDAGDDAERFEQSFYRFIAAVAEQFAQLPHPPTDVEAALTSPLWRSLRDRLPTALQLNFDMELEDLCDAHNRLEDDA